jgi:DMSO/TMAO reductase YedYZ molybdopterin-dependent catalytic subunit
MLGETVETTPSEYSSCFARRRVVSTLISLGGLAVVSRTFGYSFELQPDPDFGTTLAESGARELVRYPEKTGLILLTDRPPQLETPLKYFSTDVTPNDAFFVRWHLSGIPTNVDLRTFRLEVSGHVSKPLSLSLSDLQSKFEPV